MIKPRVYVATKANNYLAAQALMSLIIEAGGTISYDWTQDVEKYGEADGAVPIEVQAECARNDIAGVLDCDYLVLIPVDEMRGAYIEVGVALTHAVPVVVLGPLPPTCFFHLPGVTEYPRPSEGGVEPMLKDLLDFMI